jgi:hypothetical protein
MRKAILLLMMTVLSGCDQSAETPAAPVALVAPATQAANSTTGVVLETIDVDSYTYLRLDTQGSETWVASSPTMAAEGDVVRFSGAMEMTNFHSKTLDRTFESILFVSGVELVGSNAAAKPASPHATDPHAAVKAEGEAYLAAGANKTVAAEAISVQALEGGKNIGELFAEHEQLEGQEVSLRAKVVKFSPNVLGKNWVTLQDGTGTAPDDKLVVTTAETVEIGDEVVVKGLVKSNVDIGAGYAYKVLLEGARFNK